MEMVKYNIDKNGTLVLDSLEADKEIKIAARKKIDRTKEKALLKKYNITYKVEEDLDENNENESGLFIIHIAVNDKYIGGWYAPAVDYWIDEGDVIEVFDNYIIDEIFELYGLTMNEKFELYQSRYPKTDRITVLERLAYTIGIQERISFSIEKAVAWQNDLKEIYNDKKNKELQND